MSNIITVDTPVVLTTTVEADKLDPTVLMQFLSLGDRREEFIKELVHATLNQLLGKMNENSTFATLQVKE